MKRDSGQYLGWNAFPNRKADLIRCYHHPHPPQAVPPLPEGEGSLRLRITSLVEGEGSLRTIPPDTLGKSTFWKDGFTRSCRIHCFQKLSKTFSLEGEGARRADEGGVRGTSEILPDHFQNLFSSLKHVMIPEP